MKLRITHLYPDLLNTYGDRGNIIALTKRAEWRGIDVSVTQVSLGNALKPNSTDWYFIGGGQDAAQASIAADLANRADVLLAEVRLGVPLLAICGGYQLLGKRYIDPTGEDSTGIGLFDVITTAPLADSRMVGNLLIEGMGDFAGQQFIGFENHGGRSQLGPDATPFGKVEKGFGNNAHGFEGCVVHHAIGTYLHGSLLPKNPWLTDWLLQTALEQQTGKTVHLKPLDDSLEQQARTEALSRFK